MNASGSVPGDVDGLVAAIRQLRGDTGRRMGEAAHALFLREFNRPIATTRITELLAGIGRP